MDTAMSEGTPNFTITEKAQTYLADLLAKQEVEGMSIRVFVTKPGTPYAETCIAYCKPGEQEPTDLRFDYPGFPAWVDVRSEHYLADALIDFQEDRMGGQLTIKAPKARVASIDGNSSLEDRINYVLYNEINPALASHGGQVTLHEIVDENKAVLQFGGGCQGCGMVDVTLKEGVEKTLREKIPELEGVMDVTDHSYRENAYYK